MIRVYSATNAKTIFDIGRHLMIHTSTPYSRLRTYILTVSSVPTSLQSAPYLHPCSQLVLNHRRWAPAPTMPLPQNLQPHAYPQSAEIPTYIVTHCDLLYSAETCIVIGTLRHYINIIRRDTEVFGYRLAFITMTKLRTNVTPYQHKLINKSKAKKKYIDNCVYPAT